MGQANDSQIKLREQIQRCAASAFNMQRGHDVLRDCQQILSQRAYLAYLIDRDLIKNKDLAIQQFESFNERLKQHLSL